MAIIDDIHKLNEKERLILQEYIKMTEFVLEITEVKEINENFGLREFHVKTTSGERSFSNSFR